MEPWQALVAAALVGTGRQTPQSPGGEGALKALLDQLDWSQPEGALLAAAGAIALHQRIGQHPPQKDWPAVEPCSLADVPIVKTAIARHLDTAMSTYPDVLPELLSLIAQTRQRIPERQLPRLLQMGQQTSALRPYVTAVVGKRGQWLAAQQPDWSYAKIGGAHEFSLDSPQLQDVWVNGCRSERMLLFQRWREADPNAARGALEAVWSTESAKDREAFINVLETNLTMADEPFLEVTLSDRAKGVRQATAHLLSRLPESRLCQRMVERVQPLVQLKSKGKRLTIEITLPATYESAWEHDGINTKARSDQGLRGWWLEQILAATPLDIWGDPIAAIRALTGHPWQGILLSGWGVAALYQQRIDWADAFLDNLEPQILADVLVSQLLALLPPQRQEQWLRARLPNKPNEEDVIRWLLLMARSSQFWDLAFSKLILEQLMTVAKNSSHNAYGLTYEIRNFRLTLHPDLAPDLAIALEAVSNAANASRHWENTLLELLKYLSFRWEINRTFQSSE